MSLLDKRIDPPTSLAEIMAAPASTPEWERLEARKRQCHAAWRYLLDLFGVPGGTILREESYYAGASAASPLALFWRQSGPSRVLEPHPCLQGLLVAPSG